MHSTWKGWLKSKQNKHYGFVKSVLYRVALIIWSAGQRENKQLWHTITSVRTDPISMAPAGAGERSVSESCTCSSVGSWSWSVWRGDLVKQEGPILHLESVLCCNRCFLRWKTCKLCRWDGAGGGVQEDRIDWVYPKQSTKTHRKKRRIKIKLSAKSLH